MIDIDAAGGAETASIITKKGIVGFTNMLRIYHTLLTYRVWLIVLVCCRGIAVRVPITGGNALFIQVDISKEAECSKAINEAHAHYGRIGALSSLITLNAFN